VSSDCNIICTDCHLLSVIAHRTFNIPSTLVMCMYKSICVPENMFGFKLGRSTPILRGSLNSCLTDGHANSDTYTHHLVIVPCAWLITSYSFAFVRACVLHLGIHSEVSFDIDEGVANAWFDRYADSEATDMMYADGILQFCSDLKVEPEDVLLLLVSYKMKAENMLEYKREEFIRGLKAIGCSTAEEVQKAAPALRSELDSKPSFKKIYAFAYNFAKVGMPVVFATCVQFVCSCLC
jgi:hypothetical protein